jgi:hypothetical protein
VAGNINCGDTSQTRHSHKLSENVPSVPRFQLSENVPSVPRFRPPVPSPGSRPPVPKPQRVGHPKTFQELT